MSEVQFNVIAEEETRSNLAAVAKRHKITQGEVLDVIFCNANIGNLDSLTDMFETVRAEKLAARDILRAERKAKRDLINAAVANLSEEDLIKLANKND